MTRLTCWSCFFFFPLFMLSISCGGSDHPLFYRIIDHLQKRDISESPYKELYSRFPAYRETVPASQFYEIVPDVTGAKRYLHQLESPVLAGEDPHCWMKVSGGDARPLTAPQDGRGETGWQVLERTRGVALDKTLFRGDTLDVDVILPTGEVEFEILGSNPQPHDYIPFVRLVLNERRLGKVPIRDHGSAAVRGEVSLGEHDLKIVFDDAVNKTGIPDSGMFCHVKKLMIRTRSDVFVMLHHEGTSHLQGDYRLQYLVDPLPTDSLFRSSPDVSVSHELHAARQAMTARLEDLGILEDPFGIKRKAYFEGRWANVLLAPPRTAFRCSLSIPSNALLDFGCGVLPGTDRMPSAPVRFRITMIDGENTIRLADRIIPPDDLHRKTAFTEMQADLSCCGGKTVSLVFETEALQSGNQSDSRALGMAFWYNPVVYQPVKPDTDPNVILISIDTLRPDHLGCYGYPRDTSPVIDRVASEAVLFTHTFSPSSWTLPAHISLLTSLNVAHHGVDLPRKKLGPDVKTIADVLRTHGYVTRAFTGGAYVDGGFGFSKGFDIYVDKGVRSIKELSQHSLQWIRDNKNKRFFLFLHTYQPHDPYGPPARFGSLFLADNNRWDRIDLAQHLGGSRGLYKTLPPDRLENVVALYDGEIRYTDEELIAPLVRLLRELSLWDRTMVVITSDHGEEFHDHGSWFHGATLYNELIKVPLIMKFPNGKHRGNRINTYVRTVDIMPTILEELNINADHFGLDGESLGSIVAREEAEHRTFVSEQYGRVAFKAPSLDLNSHLKKVALNTGRYKLILSINSNKMRPFFSPPPPHRKSVEIELYDLEDDPYETVNIAHRHKRMTDSLSAYIPAYFQEADKRRSERGEHVLDSETRQQLKALGYIY